MSAGLPLVLHGDASSLWCACFAPDVAAAFVAAVGNEMAYNRAYNTAGEEIVTWRRYWEIAADAFGSPSLETVNIPTAVLERVFGVGRVCTGREFPVQQHIRLQPGQRRAGLSLQDNIVGRFHASGKGVRGGLAQGRRTGAVERVCHRLRKVPELVGAADGRTPPLRVSSASAARPTTEVLSVNRTRLFLAGSHFVFGA